MPIINYQIIAETPQPDGRRYVRERHEDHLGQQYDIEYFAEPGVEPALVIAERAAIIGAKIDAKETAVAAAHNWQLPISGYEAKQRFTLAERIAIRAAAATDPVVADILDLINSASWVYADNPAWTGALDYLLSVGLLSSQARRDEIGNF